MISKDRVRDLNNRGLIKNEMVLYWMQASQRTLHNHALEFAIDKGNELGLPVVVFFGIMEDYPEANERHFKFMLEGLSEVQRNLKNIGIKMVVRRTDPLRGVLAFSDEASVTVCDRGYLRHQVVWRRELAEKVDCQVVEVESDVIVPVESAADKEMYSAATLRQRIHRSLDGYMAPPEQDRPTLSSLEMSYDGLDLADHDAILGDLDVNREVAGVSWIRGGTSEAIERFHTFLAGGLNSYHTNRNDPSLGIRSDMSPYLHFGQIAPLTLALEAMEAGSPGTETYLEELIVRRELAFNFVHYNPMYDSFDCLPTWAKNTLIDHSWDLREYVYCRGALEKADTHDPYWNAAQKEMRIKGKMHNYMRMYWGKKILEWMEDPREAYQTALYLNNKYSIDGRDPNSYAGIAWCFGKHDRPWAERPLFGKVRYMNDNGLRRKFNMEEYVKMVDEMEG